VAKMAESVKRLLRLYHTLRHLKPTQLAFFFVRRGFPARDVKPSTEARVREEQYLQPLLPVSTFQQSEHSFTCLNQTAVFEGEAINWNPSNKSRLWCYHLHYFDQLRDIYRSDDNKRFLVEDWIKRNPQGSQPAWEPYTVSLRIVNWVAFMLSDASPRRLPIHWLDSLYEQTLWLEKNDERHILANHYFENIKAWLFSGVFFQGKDAERWLAKGKRLLLNQLSEQFLDDGGHYERSPHYHALMLENLLDLLNLSRSNSSVLGVETEKALEETAERGLSFLHRITLPDGSIPLFNDAVQAAAPSIDELYVYAGKFIDIMQPEYSSGIELISEPSSGIYGYRHNDDMLLIDCGDIGPDYQPGHTHCDFLSYELILDDEPVIVDSGVYEYQAGVMRDYVRSTAAHNTISVDDQEQSEIWGEFRVARRAKKLQAEIVKTADDRLEFCGSYQGFPQVSGCITHRRKIACSLSSGGTVIDIHDEVLGQGVHSVDSYLHFHPDIELKDEGDGRWGLFRDQVNIAMINVEDVDGNDASTRLAHSWYCPEFGLKYRNQMLVMTTETELPASLCYRIEKTS